MKHINPLSLETITPAKADCLGKCDDSAGIVYGAIGAVVATGAYLIADYFKKDNTCDNCRS